ncbi:MAG: hypothetical protein QM731_24375 [Chitinophagaceae bacterium]
MQLFTRFLLLLCLVMCGAYAHTNHAAILYTTPHIQGIFAHTHLCAEPTDKASICNGNSSSTKKDYERTKAVEIEDDDDTESFKHYSTATHHYLTFFYSQAYAQIFHSFNNRLPFCEHFSYSSTSRFIMNRVIRI